MQGSVRVEWVFVVMVGNGGGPLRVSTSVRSEGISSK